MKKINIGIIGAGSFSSIHLDGLERISEANVCAICDLDEANAKNAAQKYSIPFWCTDYHDILKKTEIDAVIVVTGDQAHRQATVDALNVGKHVLCEKPMALCMDDCKAMIEASEKSAKKLMIGQICRYTPGFIKAKELVESGEIGELFYVESEYAHDYSKIGGNGGWRVTPERHPFIGGACHAMDLLRWIAGDPHEVFAYSNHKILTDWPVDDCTIAVMKFPGDVIGKVFNSVGCKRAYTMRTCLYGSKGTIVVDNTTPLLDLYKADVKGSERDFGRDWQNMKIQLIVPIDNHNTYGEIKEFIDCIVNDKDIVMTGKQGASTVSACLSVVESAKTGMPVKVNYDF